MTKHEEAKEAEELAAEHMRRLGFAKAKRGRTGPDSGVDITAPGAIAQVKDTSSRISESHIRNLNGSGHHNTSKLFYSASGFTHPAMEFADENGIALFTFELATRTVTPVGALAWNLAHQAGGPGLTTDHDPEPPAPPSPPPTSGRGSVPVALTNPAQSFDFPEHVPADTAPDELVPFTIGPDQVDRAFREWAARERLAKSDFKKRATAGDRRSVYLPYWSGRVQLYSNYRGKVGLFEEVVDYHPRKGHRRRKTTRWTPAEGQVVHQPVKFLEPAFDPESTLGPAAGSWLNEVRKTWDLSRAVPFRPEALASHQAPQHSVTPEAVVSKVREDQRRQIAKDIRAHIGGDAQDVSWSDVGDVAVEWRLVLMPAWIVDWTFSGKTGTVLINGQSGKAAGKSVTSVTKTLALASVIAAVVVLCCGGVYLAGRNADGIKGTAEITAEDYELQGKTWPFTADTALLTCYEGQSITATVNGQVYFLEPVKDDDLELAGTEGWQDAATIVVDDGSFSSTALYDVVADARRACWS